MSVPPAGAPAEPLRDAVARFLAAFEAGLLLDAYAKLRAAFDAGGAG
ncbi:MAG TPA: hypothetical protein VIF57_26685 [Polyangia bacterium]